jgi:hypothetical protein
MAQRRNPRPGSKVQLAEFLMNVDLRPWVLVQRAEGMSWAQVALKIKQATSYVRGAPVGGVVIGEEWLRVLYGTPSEGLNVAKPEPKADYPPPDQEKRSTKTQVAADRWLHGPACNGNAWDKDGNACKTCGGNGTIDR